MKDLVSELENIFTKKLDTSTLVHAMSNFRLILEKERLQSEFPTLNLYCNWILHDSISASLTAFRILEDLTDSMISHNSDTGTKWISDAVVEGLRLHRLQIEILKLADQYGIGIEMIREYFYWKAFVRILLGKLKGRPLLFPENPKKKVKTIYERIVTKAYFSGHECNGVISVWFTELVGKYHWSIKTLATRSGNVKIVGVMHVITQEMVDNYQTET